jgi:acetyltransferase-like isoleucine patch superfamily enzyme
VKLQAIPVRIGRRLGQRVSRFYSVRDNVIVGRDVHIGIGSTLWAPNKLVIYDNVYIGKRCTIEVNGSIGEGCLLANHVGLVGRYDHDHHTVGVHIRSAPWVGNKDVDTTDKRHAVVIEDDCWLGFAAVVLSGVTVGRGSIVSAGAVVVADVQPYSIVAGCPAKVIGARFSEAEIIEHERRLGRGRPPRPSAGSIE